MEPFFFNPDEWIPCRADFPLNAVQGKGYEADSGTGKALWAQVGERLDRRRALQMDPGPALVAAAESAKYGQPTVVMPRLGQGAFRVMVTDAYGRRCAMSNERTLPVLQAAHIRPYAENGPHLLSNGLLLRSDLHTLFDLGYLSVNPSSRTIDVSPRIREEFENGRDYYQLQGRVLAAPGDPRALPGQEFLEWHRDVRFR